MPTIAVLGTYDSKGPELAFVADLIRQRGHTPLLIDVGTYEPAGAKPDITRAQVASAAGVDFDSIAAANDRGRCVTAMTTAAPVLIGKLAAEKKIQGIISLGGGGGTAIATSAMRGLPIGFPKVMVSTLASGNTSAYVGTSDIVMFPSVVDIAGLNRISRLLFARAAGAICGMVETPEPKTDSKPVVVASCFGNTTQCVNAARQQLEKQGIEVLVFHATGTGGRTMEALIESGMVAGVLDITTTEWADELVGGVLAAGPHRLEAAGKARVPAIVTPGCLDMVNFGALDTVPAKFRGRKFYEHNPQITLMRTTPEECAQLGRILAEKVNAYTAPVTVLLPKKAISVISAPEQQFDNPKADEALFSAIRQYLRKDIPLRELDCEINDPEFAAACVESLLQNMALANSPPLQGGAGGGG